LAGMVGTVHDKFVHTRRVKVLSERLAALIPPKARILDVGCGDGIVAQLIIELRPDVSIEGIDVLVRENTRIPVKYFDGFSIPHPDDSFDVVMFVDVLHHTEDPTVLLREAERVGKHIVIKDHFQDGFLAHHTLRLMDWVGNAHHGVVLPYNYWPKKRWKSAFDQIGLKIGEINESLGLYPAPVSWFFERQLHYVARLDRTNAKAHSANNAAGTLTEGATLSRVSR
jgi:SAM-dependent methyltransferase